MFSVFFAQTLLTALFVLMLAYGSLVRYWDMRETLGRLSKVDALKEWLGYLFFIALCALMIAVFWLTHEVSLGIIAFGGLVFYIHSARRQFPVF